MHCDFIFIKDECTNSIYYPCVKLPNIKKHNKVIIRNKPTDYFGFTINILDEQSFHSKESILKKTSK